MGASCLIPNRSFYQDHPDFFPPRHDRTGRELISRYQKKRNDELTQRQGTRDAALKTGGYLQGIDVVILCNSSNGSNSDIYIVQANDIRDFLKRNPDILKIKENNPDKWLSSAFFRFPIENLKEILPVPSSENSGRRSPPQTIDDLF